MQEEDKKARISFINEVANPELIDTKRIFERFYTGDRSRNKGTGLELSIVSLLSEQLGGNVGADLKGKEISIWVEFIVNLDE